MIERTRQALNHIPAERRSAAHLLFTAHSIPQAMAANCKYESQFHEASRLVAEAIGHANWRLVYQSRSGPPTQPWLGPDIGDALEEIASGVRGRESGVGNQQTHVVVIPIGFISDHMEVLYDLDDEARRKAERLGMNLVRAGTVGRHPRFVQMIRELVEERLSESQLKPAMGNLSPSHDVCQPDCCQSGAEIRGRPKMP